MAIPTTKAAEIAKRHGLSLQDAAGLASLANTTGEAEEIAAKFAGTEASFRNAVRSIFEPDPDPGVARFADNIKSATDPGGDAA